MPQSLHKAIQPERTKGFIKQYLQSAKGRCIVWCIVEGTDDVEVYTKFIDSKTTNVKPAVYGEHRKGGYESVCNIVKELPNEVGTKTNLRIFGICDADYTSYARYPFPKNVFTTDHRDIEIMMLNSHSVQKALGNWDERFPQKIIEASKVCSYLGYLRIYNHVKGLKIAFHDNINVSHVWNENTHSLKRDWEKIFISKFIKLSPKKANKTRINQFISSNKLRRKPWRDVCRGHDVLNLLHLMMINYDYSSYNILKYMSKTYSYDDFKSTNLYRQVQGWASKRKLKVFA